MMKIIFDEDTEIGKCDYEPENGHGFRYAEPDYSTIYAHTVASLNGQKGMLKIEHHCYLRHGEELPDQPWIKPEIALETALESEEETVAMIKTLHEQFVQRVRKQFPEDHLV